MDLVSREVYDLPVFDLNKADVQQFEKLTKMLLDFYHASKVKRHRQGKRINVTEINFDVQQSKPIIDEIDRILAKYYGLTDEELDFILNYDIKYRMGAEAEGEG